MTAKLLTIAALSAVPSLAAWPQAVCAPTQTESAPTVVLIGGMKGSDASGPAIEHALLALKKRKLNLCVVPLANPDAADLVFPPTGTAYRQNRQSHYLWRWLGLHAPDLVIVVGKEDYGLTNALKQNRVAGVGSIPALRAASTEILRSIPKQIAKSEAHIERDRRLARTPRQLAEELSKVYGHDFDPPIYIPAMALIARIRLGQQTDVAALVAPYINGAKDSLAKVTPSHLAGHLVFAELAASTGDPRYLDRVRAAADLPFSKWDDMSDAVFMGCPIMASAGKLTGDPTYFDRAFRHLQFMQKLCLRPDGLYRHSPLNDAAWGRGNAFPALGLAWTLQNMPESHPAYAEMVRDFKAHISALEKFQDRDGMWHEIIDQPGSYPEFSATAMIATAMHRGVSHGWLDRSYETRVQAGWKALLMRIGPEGELVDVCESTGKQKSLEDYLNRAASFGKDARGGGMALLLATEIF